MPLYLWDVKYKSSDSLPKAGNTREKRRKKKTQRRIRIRSVEPFTRNLFIMPIQHYRTGLRYTIIDNINRGGQ